MKENTKIKYGKTLGVNILDNLIKLVVVRSLTSQLQARIHIAHRWYNSRCDLWEILSSKSKQMMQTHTVFMTLNNEHEILDSIRQSNGSASIPLPQVQSLCMYCNGIWNSPAITGRAKEEKDDVEEAASFEWKPNLTVNSYNFSIEIHSIEYYILEWWVRVRPNTPRVDEFEVAVGRFAAVREQ